MGDPDPRHLDGAAARAPGPCSHERTLRARPRSGRRIRPDRPLAHDLARALVLADTLPGWMAQPSVGRPLRELHLPHHLRPDRVRPPCTGWTPGEGRVCDLEPGQPLAERDRLARAEAGADLADVQELAVRVVHAEEQCADPGAPSFGIGKAADDELLLLDTLRFQPAAPAAGFVGGVAAFRHHALEGHAAGVAQESLAVACDVVAVSQRRTGAARIEHRAQGALALFERSAGEIATIEVDEVED